MLFKDFSYKIQFLAGDYFVWRSRTICAILVEGIIYGEHSYEIILNLHKWFRRCSLKRFLVLGNVLFGGVEIFVKSQ